VTPATQDTQTLSQWFDRLHHVMPWGSSTCSKAAKVMPDEPVVITRGKGCRVWDDRGREFIDYRNALGPVSLGYCFEPVDRAIRKQLENGIIFGHPHPIECEVAELICDVIPCAEQARFLKTGGEAIAATIRAARQYTGRDYVVQVGYNGWINSLGALAQQLPGQVSNQAPAGVPEAISNLHRNVAWNDEAGMQRVFDELDGQIAAVVVAAEYLDMQDGETYYPFLRKLTEQHGVVLIFDEIVTGFRLALGGVQEYFNVVPDMAVYAKGIANGMPLSVYVGKRELMQSYKESMVSTTYGGETLSLAAAKASIETYQQHDVVGHLWTFGRRLMDTFNALLAEHKLPAHLGGIDAVPYWDFRANDDWSTAAELSSAIMRSAFRQGVSMYNACYVNFSHQQSDIDETGERFAKALSELAD